MAAVGAGEPDGGRRAVLVYDAECADCRASALWIMRRALAGGALEVLPVRSGVRRARFPRLDETACSRAMHLVLPDGRVLAGVDAIPELLPRVRAFGWLGRVLRLPGLRALAPAVARRLATRRLQVLCPAA
jgi:predicted DCC family thiol-disulfide oxidoreductase YuxK